MCGDHPTVVVPSFFGVIASLPRVQGSSRTPGTILPLAPAIAPHLVTVQDLVARMGDVTDTTVTASSPENIPSGKPTRIAYTPGAHHAQDADAPCKGRLVRFIVLRGSRKVSDTAQIVEWGSSRALVGVEGGRHVRSCLAAWTTLASRSVATDEVAAALAKELTV
jgi:hypothetical protein